MLNESIQIPAEVVEAIRYVEDQLPPEMYDPETVTAFAHHFGFRTAEEWLLGHRDLYFAALREANAGIVHLTPR